MKFPLLARCVGVVMFGAATCISGGARADDLGLKLPDFDAILMQGETQILLSGYAWHDPNTYKNGRAESLNSEALGLGLAKSLPHDDGTIELLYAQVFSDSIREPELTAGYAKEWSLGLSKSFDLAAGFTIGFTQRSDIFGGIPAPYILPVASIKLSEKLTIYGTYIPPMPSSLHIGGDTLFIFAGMSF